MSQPKFIIGNEEFRSNLSRNHQSWGKTQEGKLGHVYFIIRMADLSGTDCVGMANVVERLVGLETGLFTGELESVYIRYVKIDPDLQFRKSDEGPAIQSFFGMHYGQLLQIKIVHFEDFTRILINYILLV